MSVPLGRAPRSLLPSHDVDTLLQLARGGADRSRVILALVRRLVEIQDEASEAEMIRLVDEVAALLLPGDAALH